MRVWQFGFNPFYTTHEEKLKILRSRGVKSVFLSDDPTMQRIFAQSDVETYRGVPSEWEVPRLVIQYALALRYRPKDDKLLLMIEQEAFEYFLTLELKDQVIAHTFVDGCVVGEQLAMNIADDVMDCSVKQMRQLKMPIKLEGYVFIAAIECGRFDIIDSTLERASSDRFHIINRMFSMICHASDDRFRNAVRFCRQCTGDESGEEIIRLIENAWELPSDEMDSVRARMLREIAPDAGRELFETILAKSSAEFVAAFDEL